MVKKIESTEPTLKRYLDKGHRIVCIPEEHWLCPKCGVGHLDGDGLYLDWDPEWEDEDAGDLLNDHDPEGAELYCNECHGNYVVGDLYREAAKKLGLVQCPCCLGAGSVDKSKAKRYREARKKK